MSLSRRTELFFRIRELVHEHSEDLARILTLEHGKVLSDAKGEVARGLEVIEFCCGIPELTKGGLLGAGLDRDRRLLDPPAARRRRRDHAVQLPAMVPMWMWAPAIACGTRFVLKPSEKDPSPRCTPPSC
jgi:malonate-semialdehyde dehydrogenase (acetylating)/methylmalonate-semialdehyde dehydrogenase